MIILRHFDTPSLARFIIVQTLGQNIFIRTLIYYPIIKVSSLFSAHFEYHPYTIIHVYFLLEYSHTIEKLNFTISQI